MKRLEVNAKKKYSKTIERILSDHKLVFSKVQSVRDRKKCVFYSVACPNDLLDEVLSEITKSVDMRYNENSIIITDINAYVSQTLQKQEKKEPASEKNPIELILEPVKKYLELSTNTIALVIISTLIAIAGLFLNNVPILIGAMILSPLLGPITAVIVNASLGKTKATARAESTLLILVLIAFASSATATGLLNLFHANLTLTNQILIRIHATVFDLIVALLLGGAAGLAISSDLQSTLVGIAVGAALVPPLTVAGIMLAFGLYSSLLSALTLTFIYIFGLKIGGMIAMRVRGVTPRRYYQKEEAKKYSGTALLIFAAVLLLLIYLVLIVPY